jgi:hypothetical protein
LPATEQQNEWVSRVLGLDAAPHVPSSPLGKALDGRATLRIWQDAKDEADAQLVRLYGALRITEIATLSEIADEIEDVLGGMRVSLPQALMEYDRAGPANRATLRDKVLVTIGDYENILAADHRVLAADDNPFGVTVTLTKTLGGALRQLRQMLNT